MGSTVAIDVSNVSKIFASGTAQEIKALDDVSVAVPGCGKTTLLRLIAGFKHATSGSIQLDGAEISSLAPYDRPVNTVFQNYVLFFWYLTR